MRRLLVLLAMVLCALPLAAQNTDIESLSGLQFNFGNPGARSLGMGGAFLGLADDASAAEANPAGLTILRKPEFSLEARNIQQDQIFTTNGTYPDLKRTAFTAYSNRIEPVFASFVYPLHNNFTVGVYYHEPLQNRGAGQDVDVQNSFFGQPKVSVPDFYLPRDGTPVSKDECDAIRQRENDFFACLQYTLLPFVSAVDIREQTFGLAGAYKIGNFSFGATARYQRFSESAFTFRLDNQFANISSVAVQATSDITSNDQKAKPDTDITFTGGVKWAPSDKFSIGAVYKQGAKFKAPTFAANADTNFDFVKVADTTFHVPDVYGIGVSFRPIPVLTIDADAVHVTYSNLVDNFISINADIRAIDKAYKASDVTEIHLGGEYFFSTKIPFAVRAGVWRDPDHAVEYRGPVTAPDAVAAAMLFPKGSAQTHYSVGAGLAWPRFQIDAAYDRSPRYRVGSISAVARF
ncbi:MAG TPA: outer membrane protein transport protein [Thermoanaerobaculia bacterium]|jgi:long-chain fatty acid transport protein|nr:outer membrane protein transport protein [Thermoanaerobaculia bacterium]